MILWPKSLTYGNWGGPGWCGGEWRDYGDKVDWTVEPIDEMDGLFWWHDWRVQHGYGRYAHYLLAQDLRKIDPPVGVWARAYRLAAIAIFTVLGLGAD